MDILIDTKARLVAGDLSGAIEIATGSVRKNPSDTQARALLADLLSIAGDLDRAELQLVALEKISSQAALSASLHRQLLRAEKWRQECFAEGRPPAFLGQPDAQLALHLRAIAELRAGDHLSAAASLADAEEGRKPLPVELDGVSVEDFRDADDLTASFFEVLTTTGKYYWVPMSLVRRVELRPPTRPRDLIWRQAGMTVEGGPDGEVYLPAIYAPIPSDERARLGQVTEWNGEAPVRGTGLRTFLGGDDGWTLGQFAVFTNGDEVGA